MCVMVLIFLGANSVHPFHSRHNHVNIGLSKAPDTPDTAFMVLLFILQQLLEWEVEAA